MVSSSLRLSNEATLINQSTYNLASLNSLSSYRGKFLSWGLAVGDKFTQEQLADDLCINPKIKLENILQRSDEINEIYDYTENTKERILHSDFVNRYHNGVQILYNQGGGARFGYTIFGDKGFASTLTASTSRHYERYEIGNRYRRLTNVEYARLMGFPDDWCRCLSLFDQHTAFGNAVVPDCVNWIAKQLLLNKTPRSAVA